MIFKEQEDADWVLETFDNYLLYEKPMQINYSRSKSDLFCKLEGKEISEETKEERLKWKS